MSLPERKMPLIGLGPHSAVTNSPYSIQYSETDDSPSKNISKLKICGVCNEKVSKYRCPRCFLPYCSVACSAVHKAKHPATEPSLAAAREVVPEPRSNLFSKSPIPGTVAAAGFRSPFAVLDESSALQTLFRMYPLLPSQLEEINRATLPPYRDQQVNEQAHPRSYPRVSGRSRGRVYGRNESWTYDDGLQKGVQALSRAREACGKDGEGVREFSKLILQILSGDGTVDASELIHEELANENARIISQLLNGEI